MLNQVIVGEQANVDSAVPITARGGRGGDILVSELNGRFFELAYRKRLYTAYATVTAPVIFSTAAGTGGPLLWNGSSGYNAVVMAVGVSVSVVTTVAGSLGLTGNTGQTAAPTTTTAIDKGPVNMFLGGPTGAMNLYRVGTVASAGNFFVPFMTMNTGALTTTPGYMSWFEFPGGIVVPPQAWVSVAGSATLTTLQTQIALIWAELPI